MQSEIQFPTRTDVADWYTFTSVLGSGGFGVATEARDDRIVLLRLKWYWNDIMRNDDDDDDDDDELYPLPENEHDLAELMPTDYDLLTVAPTESAADLRGHADNDPKLVLGYLSRFSRAALLAGAIDQGYSEKQTVEQWARQDLSRHALIMRIARQLRVRVPAAELGDRPVVVLKLVGAKYANARGETLLPVLNQRASNAARTEVSALARVSSITPVYATTAENGGNNPNEVNVEQIEPVGCLTIFNDHARPIVCLRDYFQYEAPDEGHLGPVYVLAISNSGGRDLYGYLETCMAKLNRAGFPRPFPPLFIWYTAWSMLHSLEYIHSLGVIHNDIKLDNIMYDPRNNEMMLIDFGLSCHAIQGENGPPGTMDHCDTHGGTPEYTAPEYAHEPHYRFPVSDVWSLGVVLWEMAVGYPYRVPGETPFDQLLAIARGERPNVLAIEPPFGMWKYEHFIILLEGMLHRDPSQRFTATRGIEHILRAFDEFSGPDHSDEHVGQWLYDRVRLTSCFTAKPPPVPGAAPVEPPLRPTLVFAERDVLAEIVEQLGRARAPP